MEKRLHFLSPFLQKQNPEMPLTDPPFSKDQMIKEIERLGPWWHTIDLGRGIKTESSSDTDPDHPMRLWQEVKKHIPDNLNGKTVADFGCNAGFFCLEAKKRGASRVVGVDINSRCIEQAKFAAKALGLEIEYYSQSIFQLEHFGSFDIVFCFGLLYHLDDFAAGLEKILLQVRELIIIESAVISYPVFPPQVKRFASGFYKGKTARSVANASAVKEILNRSGFKVLAQRPYRAGFLRESIRFTRALKNTPLSYLVQRKCADSKFSSILAQKIFKDYTPIDRMVFVARKAA